MLIFAIFPTTSLHIITQNTISMKTAAFLSGVASLAGIASATVAGFDISHYQPNVNFAQAYAGGARFVIIKV